MVGFLWYAGFYIVNYYDSARLHFPAIQFWSSKLCEGFVFCFWVWGRGGGVNLLDFIGICFPSVHFHVFRYKNFNLEARCIGEYGANWISQGFPILCFYWFYWPRHGWENIAQDINGNQNSCKDIMTWEMVIFDETFLPFLFFPKSFFPPWRG